MGGRARWVAGVVLGFAVAVAINYVVMRSMGASILVGMVSIAGVAWATWPYAQTPPPRG